MFSQDCFCWREDERQPTPADGCGLTGARALEHQDDHGDHVDGEGESEHGDDWSRFTCMARGFALKMKRRGVWTTTTGWMDGRMD